MSLATYKLFKVSSVGGRDFAAVVVAAEVVVEAVERKRWGENELGVCARVEEARQRGMVERSPEEDSGDRDSESARDAKLAVAMGCRGVGWCGLAVVIFLERRDGVVHSVEELRSFIHSLRGGGVL
jgi:hypothetical protein